jgi:hypothetical protein
MPARAARQVLGGSPTGGGIGELGPATVSCRHYYAYQWWKGEAQLPASYAERCSMRNIGMTHFSCMQQQRGHCLSKRFERLH